MLVFVCTLYRGAGHHLKCLEWVASHTHGTDELCGFENS